MEKLIRDNLPEIAEKNNAPIYWRNVNNVSEHIDTLERKIQEELREFWNAHYFYQTWLQSDISQEQKWLYLPVFRWKAEEEAGDVLTPYDNLIRITSVFGVSWAKKIQEQKSEFTRKILDLWYDISSIESFQSTKNQIFWTFEKWIIATFKK